MNRLRRIVYKENQKLNISEKVVLLSGMVLLCVFLFVPKANSEIRHTASVVKKQVAAILHPEVVITKKAVSSDKQPVKQNIKAPVLTDETKEVELPQPLLDTSLVFTSIKF